jgi:dTDP-4-amino-4,6-dideoxygalactose transaminase
MFDMVTNKKIEKIIKSDINLSKYVSDCLDINWLKQGKYFDEFLLELENFLKTIS